MGFPFTLPKLLGGKTAPDRRKLEAKLQRRNLSRPTIAHMLVQHDHLYFMGALKMFNKLQGMHEQLFTSAKRKRWQVSTETDEHIKAFQVLVRHVQERADMEQLHPANLISKKQWQRIRRYTTNWLVEWDTYDHKKVVRKAA